MLLLRRMGTLSLLLGASLGLLLSLDPTSSDFGLVKYSAIKYSPYLLSAIASGFFLLSCRIKINILVICFVLFFSVALSGSFFALFYYNVTLEETYLGRSLGGFVLISSYILGQMPKELVWFFRYFMRLIIMYSIASILILLLWRAGFIYKDLTQMYQVKSIILAATSLLGFYYLKSKTIIISIFILMILSMSLIAKTTSVLVLVLTIVFFIILYYRRFVRGSMKKINFNPHVVFTFTIFFMLVVGFLFSSIIQERLQTRGAGVRIELFSFRFQEFINSPFVGNLFTGTPLLDYGFLHIPSHSDTLDMLAFGGAITILLFFIPSAYIIKTSFIKFNTDFNALNPWLGFISLIYFIVMSINPILFLPGISFVFWMTLGLLARNRIIYLNRYI